MMSLDEFAAAKLAELEAKHTRRTLAETDRADGIWVERGGRRLLSFSCNDYLNFTQHPGIKGAATAALLKYGVGGGASRLVTGNHPLYAELETKLAKLKGTEAACVFGSGYLANLGIIPALVGPDDLLLVDEFSHACLWAGAQLSRGAVHIFQNNNVEHARALLEAHRHKHDHALIVTDGVFSMDGDLAPVAELAALAKEFDCWLMTDDAHGIGVLNEGRGSGNPAIDLQMGTLSKAIGSYGGYVCASKPVIDLLKTRARTLIYSTSLPPASVAAAIEALNIIEKDKALTAKPLANARIFTRALQLPQAQSPIVPLVLGEPEAALAAAKSLEEQGFLVVAIRPPTVPDGTARLRLAFTAAHEEADILRLAEAVRKIAMP